MSNLVRIIDNLSGIVLFETSMDKIDDAYSFAAMMEKEGLDILIDAPGLTETLIKSLGANENEILEYKQSLEEEMDDHESDFGCSVCPPTKVKSKIQK